MVYLSTQSLFKYLPQHDDIYARIARDVPHSRFVFIMPGSRLATRNFAGRLERCFDDYGVSFQEHCLFMPRLDHDDFLSLNMAADLLLDTFDWSGGKTSLEAIACGLPVLTCPGRLMRARHAYAMLKRMDMPELIANSADDYCLIAAGLGNDPERLALLKDRIVSRRSRLYDHARFMAGLETFYREAVRQSVPPAESTPNHVPAQDNDLAESFYNEGIALYRGGHFSSAADRFEKALACKPRWTDAMFNLARVHEAMHQAG